MVLYKSTKAGMLKAEQVGDRLKFVTFRKEENMENITILKVVLYLIGIPVAYVAMKKAFAVMSILDKPATWTVGNRNMTLFNSLFSWFTVAFALVLMVMAKISKSKKEASW